MTQPQIERMKAREAVEVLNRHGHEDVNWVLAGLEIKGLSQNNTAIFTYDPYAAIAVAQRLEREAEPRPSPAVAPGLRDDDWVEVHRYWKRYWRESYIKRTSEILEYWFCLKDILASPESTDDDRNKAWGDLEKAIELLPEPADIAAQGGTVDRSALNDIIGKLVHAVKSTKESFGEVKVGKWGDGSDCALKHTFSFVEIVKQANALDQFDFNSAVPSAPGGECVTATVECDKCGRTIYLPGSLGAPQDHLSPERRIVYRFLSLPHLRQANIAKELDLARSDEICADKNVPYELVFRRAKEQHRLANLWDAIEAQSEEKMPYLNPFAPHTQPVDGGEAKERGGDE